jgi:predicted DNA-binding protein (MmcQ/YjbR family)
MNFDQYNKFCAALPQTSMVVQWGGAYVWKVGGKVFAIAGWQEKGEQPHITFKCSPMSYELLKGMQGCRPAPYLASRGMLWIQRCRASRLKDAALKDYLRESRRLASLNLTKKLRKELGLE